MTKFNNKNIDKKLQETSLRRIKERLENIYCSEHNKPPRVELSQDRLHVVETCCKVFLQEIERSFKEKDN